MPLAHSWSVALVGLDGHLVEVEADIASGLPKTTLIGLPTHRCRRQGIGSAPRS